MFTFSFALWKGIFMRPEVNRFFLSLLVHVVSALFRIVVVPQSYLRIWCGAKCLSLLIGKCYFYVTRHFCAPQSWLSMSWVMFSLLILDARVALARLVHRNRHSSTSREWNIGEEKVQFMAREAIFSWNFSFLLGFFGLSFSHSYRSIFFFGFFYCLADAAVDEIWAVWGLVGLVSISLHGPL